MRLKVLCDTMNRLYNPVDIIICIYSNFRALMSLFSQKVLASSAELRSIGGGECGRIFAPSIQNSTTFVFVDLAPQNANSQ